MPLKKNEDCSCSVSGKLVFLCVCVGVRVSYGQRCCYFIECERAVIKILGVYNSALLPHRQKVLGSPVRNPASHVC